MLSPSSSEAAAAAAAVVVISSQNTADELRMDRTYLFEKIVSAFFANEPISMDDFLKRRNTKDYVDVYILLYEEYQNCKLDHMDKTFKEFATHIFKTFHLNLPNEESFFSLDDLFINYLHYGNLLTFNQSIISCRTSNLVEQDTSKRIKPPYFCGQFILVSSLVQYISAKKEGRISSVLLEDHLKIHLKSTTGPFYLDLKENEEFNRKFIEKSPNIVYLLPDPLQGIDKNDLLYLHLPKQKCHECNQHYEADFYCRLQCDHYICHYCWSAYLLEKLTVQTSSLPISPTHIKCPCGQVSTELYFYYSILP